MDSRTDYRKLASHHRGLYFVTPSREKVGVCWRCWALLGCGLL